MTAIKMLHGREYKITCGRFDRKIKVEVNGTPAAKIDGSTYRINLSDGEFLQFRIVGSFMTGMNLIEGDVTIEVFRHIRWYEYIFIFGPLLFLAFGAALGVSAAETSGLAAAIGGLVGLLFALAGFFACNALVHCERLGTALKIFLNLLVLIVLSGLFALFFLYYVFILAIIGLGSELALQT
ncbi:MAG: hypothetical protein HPY94_03720 [Clostridia bacterium]|nr:hypothetical protein [Clostridia bacterium]